MISGSNSYHTSQHLQTDFWEAQFETIHRLFHIKLHDRREICSHLAVHLKNPLVLSFLYLWLYTFYSAFLLHWIYQWSVAAVCIKRLSLLLLNSCSQTSWLPQKIGGNARPALFKIIYTSTNVETSGGRTAKLRKSDAQWQHRLCFPIPASLQTVMAIRPERKKMIAEKLPGSKKTEATYIWDASLSLMFVRTGFEGVSPLLWKKICFSFISLLPSAELFFWRIAANQLVVYISFSFKEFSWPNEYLDLNITDATLSSSSSPVSWRRVAVTSSSETEIVQKGSGAAVGSWWYIAKDTDFSLIFELHFKLGNENYKQEHYS